MFKNNIIRHYKKILIFNFILVILAITRLFSITIATNFEDLMPEDHPTLTASEEFDALFGSGESVYVAVAGAPAERAIATEKLIPYLESAPSVSKVYPLSSNDDMSLIFVKPHLEDADYVKARHDFFNMLSGAIDQIDSSDLTLGYTGGAFVFDYEADQKMEEGIFSSLTLTLLAVMLSVVIAFKKILLPLSLAYPLVSGVLITTAIGSFIFSAFNIFSVFFGAVLFGLGIDFGVHLLARYTHSRNNQLSKEEALIQTLKTTGGSIMVGAITTSCVFFLFAFTQFKGFYQMGILAGIGIIVLACQMIFIVPSLIMHFDKATYVRPIKKSPTGKRPLFFIYRGGLILLFFISLTFFTGGTFDYNIMSIYPKDMSASYWQTKIEDAFDIKVTDLTLKVSSHDQLEKLHQSLTLYEEIESVESILTFIPPGMTIETARPHIPDLVYDQYVQSGHYRLVIKPQNTIWEKEDYSKIESILAQYTDESLVGFSALMMAIGDLVVKDMIWVSAICLIVIFVCLLLMFKSIKHTLITMVPLLLTLSVSWSMYSILNISINIMSIVAIPILIGICIDGSIHLTHQYRHDPSKVNETFKTLCLTTLTTMIAFGGLMTINHGGLASLGATVTIGIFLSLLYNGAIYYRLQLYKPLNK